jgi:hypothetical protein
MMNKPETQAALFKLLTEATAVLPEGHGICLICAPRQGSQGSATFISNLEPRAVLTAMNAFSLRSAGIWGTLEQQQN